MLKPKRSIGSLFNTYDGLQKSTRPRRNRRHPRHHESHSTTQALQHCQNFALFQSTYLIEDFIGQIFVLFASTEISKLGSGEEFFEDVNEIHASKINHK